ncbi:zinc-ribbon domain-containing protein [Bacillus sp. FJAT-22090]|uniref:zinc-ribbon domain-containing protein n=1 Tax=Bacillus sp. FJAT-22090 TaxID=1581038 RepID=UPI001642E9F8|nr:zinc-ribbon domain-containing protein [Bacillus sp. FJAT-22090]
MCNVNGNGRVLDESKVLKDNAMLKVRPELFWEWDFEKNSEIGYDVYEMTKGMTREVYWICSKCESHRWKVSINSRSSGSGCPYCNGKKILIGYNDMWTTNPQLASLLANPQDGYKYTQMSNEKVDWKCLECNTIIINKSPNSVSNGLRCQSCSDGMSFPEKVIYNTLKTLKISFKKEMSFKWSEGKRYDFYLFDYDTIIETHGEQHKEGGFESMGGRTLEEEQENDKYKREIAINNNISNYIEIDASDTSLEVYTTRILQSGLNKIIDISNICWEEVFLKSSKSLLVEVCNYWNTQEKSTLKISEHFGISRNAITNYLKRGAEMNICGYNVEIAKANSSLIPKRSVVQLTTSNEFVAVWDSTCEAGRGNSISSKHISTCCKGKRKTSYGFKWMYKEDYEEQFGEIVS